jgi:hypothetical protein
MALYRPSQTLWEEAYHLWDTDGIIWFPDTDIFENVIFDRVLRKLHKLLVNEFFIPVYFDTHRGNQSFLLKPLEDNLEFIFNSGQQREYSILIEHELLSGGTFSRNQIKQVSETYERVKRLLHNNVNYNAGWFYGRVESITTSRDDESLLSAIQFNCVSTEMSSN